MKARPVQAKKIIAEICNTGLVYFSNDGFEVLYNKDTSSNAIPDKAALILAGFTKVEIKGTKVKSILISTVHQYLQGFNILMVEY